MKLTSNVGKGCYPKPEDVLTVEAALGSIKNRRFQLYYKGRMDGKQGPKIICSIAEFQCDERLPITGKTEQHDQTFSRLKQKMREPIISVMVTKLMQAAPVLAQTKHYSLASGVRLTPSIEQKVAKIENAYYAVTGKKIQVNSGTRTPAGQAKAMFSNMKRGDRLTIYRNQTLAGQIRSAYDTAQATGLSDQATISAMEQVIASQVTSGQYISKHLISGAVDIDVQIMSPSDKQAFKMIASKVATTVILETVNPHWHLQF